MKTLSVVLPSHNPRRDYLLRTLEGLKAQTLAREQWELLVIDNASTPALASTVDLAWHPNARIVREETLGLTPARLRGFRESGGTLIVMVDDDNVLAPDYLEQVLRIGTQLPFLGAFGGSVEPEFETPPPEWTRPYWPAIAIRPVPRSVWSNDILHWDSTPCGAGMCVRRELAERYAQDLARDPLRRSLDRTGSNLVSGGDEDLAWTGCAMGLGMGRFKELRLTHLIPPARLTPEYLSRIHEGQGYSAAVLNALWNRPDPDAPYTGPANLLRMGWRRLWKEWKGRRFLVARRKGAARARQQIEELQRQRRQSITAAAGQNMSLISPRKMP